MKIKTKIGLFLVIVFFLVGIQIFTGTHSLEGFVAPKAPYAVSVTEFGAKGDGITDDTTAIQAAATAAASKALFFPAGNYRITSEITLPADIHIYGVGKASKIYTTTDNINLISGSSVNNILIEKLQFYGDNTSSAITNGNGLYFHTCNDITIRDCFFHKFGGADANSGAINFYSSCNRVTVENNYIDGGVGGATASDILCYSGISDAKIINNRCLSTNSQGIFANAVAGNENIVSGNTCKNHSRHGIGMYYAASGGYYRSICSNNIVKDNDWTGIYAAGSVAGSGEIIIQGNIAMDNGSAGAGAFANNIYATATNSPILISNNLVIARSVEYHGIKVTGDYASILNNWILGTSNIYGIYLTIGTDHALIEGNTIKDCSSGIILEPAVSTNVEHVVINGNNIYDSNSHGIYCGLVTTTNYIDIINNYIKGDGTNGKGIYLNKPIEGKVAGNSISFHDYGIQFASNVDFSDIIFSNNFIHDNVTYGVRHYSSAVMFSLHNKSKDNGTDYSKEGGSDLYTADSIEPNKIVHGAAAPAAGTWAVGDIVWNTAPAAGGAPGWVCTTAGTPGTWKAMPNLAA